MPSPSSHDPAPDVQPARRRTLQNVFIAAVLVFQIVAPLRYYLGARGYDERFSWRMFSTLRLRDCKVKVEDHARVRGRSVRRPVSIDRDVHVAWLRLLERMRGPVVDAYLARRCELGRDSDEPVEQVDFECTCRDTDGTPLPPVKQSLDCSTGRGAGS